MTHPHRRFSLPLLGLLLCSLFFLPAQAEVLTMAVANSTCSTIKEVGRLFEQQHGTRIEYICKSSGRLAKGLNGGSISADIYISANRKWMDYMQENGLVTAQRITSPWGNELVVATRRDSALELSNWDELASDKVKRILIGDPSTAPFGRYAKQALENTGLWDRVRHKITTKKHITLLADRLAESEAGTVGILFVSNTNSKHKQLLTVDKSWHPPIRYYMAPLLDSQEKTMVPELLKFIQGDRAKKIFQSAGFKTHTP